MAEKLKQPSSKESLDKALEAASEQMNKLEEKRGVEVKEIKEAKEKHSVEKKKAKVEVEKALEKSEKKEVRKAPKAEKRKSAPRGVKKQQYSATMRRIEAKLPPYQRAFSKVIHNKAVDAVSNVAGKTVARPSGLLGGSIAAFGGLLLIYTNATRIGFEYNAGSAFIFFATLGWLTGILLEYLYNAIKQLLNR